MAISRSALEFLRRRGMVNENIRPTMRLNATDLLVHTYSIVSPPRPAQNVLRSYEGGACGELPPDRNQTRPWPGQGV